MSDPVDTEDLYCLSCGYNMRGLPGDPRRCPECGDECTIEDMRIPAEVINEQAKYLETLPVMAVGSPLNGFVLFLFLYGFRESIARSFEVSSSDITYYLLGFSFVATIIAWLYCVIRFHFEAQKGTPWLLVLVEIHIAGILIIGGFGGLCVIFIMSLMERVNSDQYVILAIAGFVVGWMVGFPVYRDARKNLAMVRSHTVRELARQEMQKRNQQDG